MDTVISANIESGLLAIFQQIELNGMWDDCLYRIFFLKNEVILRYVFVLKQWLELCKLVSCFDRNFPRY
jgi:hypothetical protein